ncbi:hypothetical protein B0T17DRAFT_157202 [Bombardia bombarda]|uniref:DUF8035 domain-containing protein n=1 Tax=Bombardia bombarda TaxID=252184 RepID=A0AA40C8W5_9PEZI|nr:hypothetical protein B0T17DRAFT_157202 [Bombardia bombarda]
MADPGRYGRYAGGAGRRSPPLYNPARASMPVTGTGGYSLYGGDIHVLPTSHHDGLPVRSAADYRSNTLPVPVTTTTYAVRKDPVSRSTSTKESGSSSSRTHGHRTSSLDPVSKRPIIITTKHASGQTSPPTTIRSGSPSRDPYRSSDEGQYYAQPASSVSRSRSTARAPFSAGMDSDEYQRLKERTEHDRLLGPRVTDPYRSSRPPAVYSNVPHHNAMDYGDEGYEYTKPSDLARYDLDHETPRRSRRDSVDRYFRPSVNITTDLARPYEQTDRRRPPPTTWGLDKLNRAPVAGGIYDGAGLRIPVPPAVPLAPDPGRRSSIIDGPASPTRATSRQRPMSLIQDVPGRPSHHDDYYRGREDDLIQQELRERERGREYYQDDNVIARGFGIRLDPKEPIIDEHRHASVDTRHRDDRRDDRREEKREERRDERLLDERPDERRDDRRDRRDTWKAYEDREPRRRSDEDLDYSRKRDYEERDRDRERDRRPVVRERDHRADDDFVYERDRKDKVNDIVPPEDERESKKDKLRDKVTAGLGIAAASIGIGSAVAEKDKKERSEETSRHRSDDVDSRSRRSDDVESRSKRSDDVESRSKRSDDLDSRPKRSDEVDARSKRSGDLETRLKRSDDIDTRPKRSDDVDSRSRPSRKDTQHSDDDFEFVELPKDRERPSRKEDIAEREPISRDSRRHAEPKPEAYDIPAASRDPSSSADDAKPKIRRRRRASSAFNPNDTASLAALKAQLATSEERAQAPARESHTSKDPSPERRDSPTDRRDPDDDSGVMVSKEESRGRELVLPSKEERQVRVVSPPREKEEKKPIKGILKQPKPQFPEEPNPVREGVAPHKDDKTKTNVPTGARWTKINRKMVNPEALTIGKERFELRDDFVIVLRVLSKEEIQNYAAATAQLRGELITYFVLGFSVS